MRGLLFALLLTLSGCTWLDEWLDASEPIRITIPERCIRAGQRAAHTDMIPQIPTFLTALLSGEDLYLEGPIGECLIASDMSTKAEIADLVVPVTVLRAMRLWNTPRLVVLATEQAHALWLGACGPPVVLSPTVTVQLVRDDTVGGCMP